MGHFVGASETEQHARIDLDVEEIEAAADAYDFTEAMRIYENGGNGLCANDNDNGVGCGAGVERGGIGGSAAHRLLLGGREAWPARFRNGQRQVEARLGRRGHLHLIEGCYLYGES